MCCHAAPPAGTLNTGHTDSAAGAGNLCQPGSTVMQDNKIITIFSFIQFKKIPCCIPEQKLKNLSDLTFKEGWQNLEPGIPVESSVPPIIVCCQGLIAQ